MRLGVKKIKQIENKALMTLRNCRWLAPNCSPDTWGLLMARSKLLPIQMGPLHPSRKNRSHLGAAVGEVALRNVEGCFPQFIYLMDMKPPSQFGG